MSNGNKIVVLRIVVSGLIGITALVGAGVLAWHHIDVPYAWWLVTLVTVGGVTGSDILNAVLSRKEAIQDVGD